MPKSEVEQDIDTMRAYLLSAFRRRDWHAVSDAANDLRVLEERLAHTKRRKR